MNPPQETQSHKPASPPPSSPSSSSRKQSIYKHAPPKYAQFASTKTVHQRRELRNAVLLKNIKDRRQNARDELRGDFILRSDSLAEQRAWERALDAEAAQWVVSVEDGDMDDDVVVDGLEELEDMLGWEEEEVLAQAQAQAQAQATKEVARVKDGYRSEGEGEDFDVLFLEAMEEFERTQGMDIS